MKLISKIVVVISSMCLGSVLYQRYGADEADYMQTFNMLYWAVVTSIIFWNAGLLANNSGRNN
ncbi:MAG: hypothetical protein KUG81_09960 [Gammaproteobacteria bacterium]|nr:hypothetical protein [Gammaproteobacteria bacterium]